MNPTTVRPTKKQKELLRFIEEFITQHGYSPSYREIMTGLDYNSVATVALHVNNLISRGHLRKRDHSARSLEVVSMEDVQPITSNQVSPSEEKWLIKKVEHFFVQAEQAAELSHEQVDSLQTLIKTLKVLGIEGAAESFVQRLAMLRRKLVTEKTTV